MKKKGDNHKYSVFASTTEKTQTVIEREEDRAGTSLEVQVKQPERDTRRGSEGRARAGCADPAGRAPPRCSKYKCRAQKKGHARAT